MVAAWMSADAGVGPAIASGSHTCSGTCADLPIAATKQPDGGGRRNARRPARNRSQDIGKLPGADRVVDDQEREQEAQVADPGDQEGLLRRLSRRLELVPEADEQVRAQAHDLPGHEGEQQVVGEDEAQHGGREQREHRVVPADALVIVHVADRVDLNARRHERHRHEQNRADRVELLAELERSAAHGTQNPRVVPGHRGELAAARPDLRKRRPRERRRSDDRPDRHPQDAVAQRVSAARPSPRTRASGAPVWREASW